MIIGISGKIHSGKDTVAKFLMFILTMRRIEKHGGNRNDILKTDNWTWEKLADAPWNHEEGKVNFCFYGGYEMKKFAGKLKQISAILLGCKPEDFESEEFKNRLLPEEWQIIEENGKQSKRTYRWFLQDFGTRGIRGLHPNAHINALFAEYHCLDHNDDPNDEYDHEHCNFPKWIITDLRFVNELNQIKIRTGISIRVNRKSSPVGTHESEIALDDHKLWDAIIDNDGTLEELASKIEQIIIDLKLDETNKS